MKKHLIFTISIITFSLNLSAQGFTLSPTEKNLNTQAVNQNILIERNENEKSINYLSSNERDVILNKYFKNQIRNWDEVDRDVLYKSLVHYKEEQLLKKYTFLTSKIIKQVQDEL